MGRIGLVVIGLACTACGRIGFDLLGAGSGGATDANGAADAVALDSGVCASAIQGPIDTAGSPAGSWVGGLVAAPSSSGFVLSYLAPDGVVFATSYTMGAGLTQVTADTNLAAGPASAIAMLVSGGTALVSYIAGNNTTLQPYNAATLATAGGSQGSSGGPPDTIVIAASGADATYMYGVGSSIAVMANQINLNGTFASGAVGIASANATEVTAVSARPGYLVTWVDAAGNASAELLAPSLATTAGPVVFDASSQQRQVRAAWASDSDTYLFAWTIGAAVDVLLTDASLTPLGSQITLTTAGSAPRVASDGHSFWVAWSADNSSATNLAAAHVLANGTFAVRSVAGSGGTVIDETFLANSSSVQLAWVERNGASAMTDLWIVPSCNL